MVQLQIPGRVLCQEQIAVLGCLAAGVQHLHDPGGGHPAPKQIRHAANKHGLRFLCVLRLAQAVAVQGRLETIRVWRRLDLLRQHMEAAGQQGPDPPALR